MVFSCVYLKGECPVSQGSVETLFRPGGKRLPGHLFRKISTKFYLNRLVFVEDFGVFFGSRCS